MELIKKSYRKPEWFEYTDKIKKRDGFACLKCGRQEPEVILQVHHNSYITGLLPWEYPLSNCLTLCKGCHAGEHNLIEPITDWILIEVIDLCDTIGVCERNGCGHYIRHSHEIYHPAWGYKSVGSTCIEYLTSEDQNLSGKVVAQFNKISKFIKDSIWENGHTPWGEAYIYSKFSHHEIRIFENKYAYQLVIKLPGERIWDYGKKRYLKNKNILQVKELAYIALQIQLSNSRTEIEVLRRIYSSTV